MEETGSEPGQGNFEPKGGREREPDRVRAGRRVEELRPHGEHPELGCKDNRFQGRGSSADRLRVSRGWKDEEGEWDLEGPPCHSAEQGEEGREGEVGADEVVPGGE